MAQYGNQHGRRTDEHGDPVRNTDEYGDPVHRPTGVDYGTTGAGGTYGTTGAHQTDPYGTTGTQQLGPQVTSPHVTSATIGAIRAEPYAATGAHPTGAQGTTGSTGACETDPDHRATGTAAGPQGGHHEKKGMMEKIKEKLPGHQHNKST
ncbi:uncharacterized protein LOC142516730 [Primulina tabacum]|uniref:uncharacterized protein LOC142516730 n=1 Tax=Primulina tabacum TaxID=48773 RepID=UPI003F59785D